MGCTESRNKEALVGLTTINMVWKVPKDKAAEVDALWKDHEAFMRKTHTMGCAGDDKQSPGLFEFWITKGEELKDAMDETKGTTGNVLYSMHEIYAEPDGIAKHMELFKKWTGEDGKSEEGKKMGELLECNKKYGVFTQLGNAVVNKCMEEKYNPGVVGKKGDPTIHLVWSVPEGEAEECDAFWEKHEAFMRKTHSFGRNESDVSPNLTHYTILKGPELKNPMDPEEGKTGNVLYIMAESYVGKHDIKKHMEVAGQHDKDMLPTLLKLNEKYGKHMDMNSAIFTNMND